MRAASKIPLDVLGSRWAVTPAGRDALEEEILAEQRRSDLKVLSESSLVRCPGCGRFTACVCSAEACQ